MSTRIIFTLCLALLSPCATMAQSTDGTRCPMVRISTPDSMVPASEPATARVELSEARENLSLRFTWAVSAGSISAGRETNEISIDTTGLSGGARLIATVTIEGLPHGCPNVFTGEIYIVPFCGIHALKFDEYGTLEARKEMGRLDPAAHELASSISSNLVLIFYGGRRSANREAAIRGERARDYLVNMRGADPKQITIVDGGYREEAWTEIWLVPDELAPPTPTPTIKLSEVRIDRNKVIRPRFPRRKPDGHGRS